MPLAWTWLTILTLLSAGLLELTGGPHSLTISLGNSPQASRMVAYDQAILFGDSLFQHSSDQARGFGLHAALQSEYIRRLDVLNRGFSGYNTEQALHVLPDIIPSPEQAHVRFLAVFFGANDACLRGALGSQHVPLDRYKSNLRKIITHPSVTAHKPHVILVTPPPPNEYGCEENDRNKGINEPRRTANHTAKYAQAVRDLASELTGEGVDIACLDLWKVMMEHVGWQQGQSPLPGSKEIPENILLKMMLHDGLHFTNVAYTIYFTEFMKVIAQTWPNQQPNDKNLPYLFPAWDNKAAWDEKKLERFE